MFEPGWLWAIVVVVAIVAITFLIVLFAAKESRSRRTRVGIFVEREYHRDEDADK